MNNLIGIRGSGKSCVLETIRYVLDIPFGTRSHDIDYKNDVVDHFLGSGGRVTLYLRDCHNKQFKIERVNGQRCMVYDQDIHVPDLNICSNILNVLYFGQKDLSRIGEDGFSVKFFENHVADIRSEKNKKEQQIRKLIREQKNLSDLSASKPELLEQKATVEQQLKVFKEKKVDEALSKQVSYEKDIRIIQNVLDKESTFNQKFDKTIESYPLFEEFEAHESKFNDELFTEIKDCLVEYKAYSSQLSTVSSKLLEKRTQLELLKNKLSETYNSLTEEFAEVKREIKLPNLKADDYSTLTEKLDRLEIELKEIDENESVHAKLKIELGKLLNDLQQLWHEEYVAFSKAIEEMNSQELPIEVKITFKGDKDTYLEHIKEILAGTGLRQARISKLVNAYIDPIELFIAMQSNDSKLDEVLGDSKVEICRKLKGNLASS
jgi:hypothetical protein